MASEVSDDKPSRARYWATRCRGPSHAALMAIVLGALMPATTSAMPVDPQRPFDAVDCQGAKVRLYEALMGNPLISAEEMAAVLVVARDGTARLCGPEVAQEIVTDFNANNIEKSK